MLYIYILLVIVLTYSYLWKLRLEVSEKAIYYLSPFSTRDATRY
jgi:hypothetical protein